MQDLSPSMEDLGEQILSLHLSSSINSFSRKSDSTELMQVIENLRSEIQHCGDHPTIQQLDYIETLSNSLASLLEENERKGAQLFDGYKVLSSALMLIRDKSRSEATKKHHVKEIESLQQQNHNLLQELQVLIVKNQKQKENVNNANQKVQTAETALEEYKTHVQSCVDDIKAILGVENATDVQSLRSELVKCHAHNVDHRVYRLTEECSSLRAKCRKLEDEAIENRESQDEYITHLREERDDLKDQLRQREAEVNAQAAARIYQLESDLQRMKKSVEESRSSAQKLKLKNKKMKEMNNEANDSLSALESMNEALRNENDRLSIENEDLKCKMDEILMNDVAQSELDAKDCLIESLKNAIDALAQQMDEQVRELSDENFQKNALMKTVQAQKSLINKLEDALEASIGRATEQSGQVDDLCAVIDMKDDEIEHLKGQISRVVGDLAEYAVRKLPEERAQEVVGVLDTANPSSIIAAFAQLADVPAPEPIQERGDDDEMKNRLFTYLRSQSHYLLSLAGESGSNTDVRNEMIQSCAKIDAFVQEYAAGLLEEPNIFDAFQMNVQPSEMLAHLKQFFDKYDTKLSRDAEELMAVLHESIAMNAVLKKFNEALNDQCQQNSYEMRRMSRDLQELKQYGTPDAEEAIVVLESELSRVKEAYGLLRERHENTKQELDREIEAKQRLENVEKAFAEKEHKLVKMTKKAISLKRKLETTSRDLTEEQEKSVVLQTSVDELNAQVAELSSNLDLLRQENAEMAKQIAEQTSIIETSAREFEESKESLMNQIRNNNRDFEIRFDEQEKAWTSEMKKLKSSHKEHLSKLQNDNELQRRRVDGLREHYDPLLTELREKLGQSRTAEASARDELRKLQSDLKDAKSKLSQATIDHRLLEIKIENMEEKAKREQAHASNRARAQQLSVQAEFENKTNEMKNDFDRTLHSFLLSICQKFRDYIQFEKSITVESSEEMFDAIAADIAQMRDRIKVCDAIESEFDRVKSVLNASSRTSLTTAVENVLAENDRLNSANKKLAAELDDISRTRAEVLTAGNALRDAKEWNQWARRLLTIASSSSNSGKSDKQVRQSLEEFVVTSLGKPSNIAWKLESLRTQKDLITSGTKLPQQSSLKVNSILPVMAALGALHRMQKMSGHLHPVLSLTARRPENTADYNDVDVKESGRCNWPLLAAYK